MFMCFLQPRKITVSGVFTQNLMGSMKDKKLSRKLQNKSVNGVAKEFSQGAATTKRVSATFSPWRPNPGDMIRASAENLQV